MTHEYIHQGTQSARKPLRFMDGFREDVVSVERNVISLTGLLCKRGVFTFIFPPYSRKAFLQKELHFRTGEGHLVLLGFSGCPCPGAP